MSKLFLLKTMMIPRVSLRVLRRHQHTSLWEENVEALSVSLSKHHCVVLHLPASDAADVDVAVAAFQGLFSAVEQAVAPLSADTPGQTAGMSSATGSQRFEFRRGAESATQLPSPTRIAAYEASAVCLMHRNSSRSAASAVHAPTPFERGQARLLALSTEGGQKQQPAMRSSCPG